jgi:ADP-ribose pyrophosphatase
MSGRIESVELEQSILLGGDGFLQLKRCRARNRRDDGTRSEAYALDMVLRPRGLDAVVVVPYARRPERLLLRLGLRPVLRLGRDGADRDGKLPPIYLLEAVAGLLEPGDEGAAGLRRRAAIELSEELGLRVSAEAIESLGPPAYLSSGVIAEQVHFCAVETALGPTSPAAGDGSPMEEGGEAVLLHLRDALQRCDEGRISDVKTECALRRLAAALQ